MTDVTRAVIRKACCGALVLLLVGGQGAAAQPLRKIGEMQLSVVGVRATMAPLNPAVPKNVASAIRVVVNGGAATLTPENLAQLFGDFEIEGELSGPGLAEPVTLRELISHLAPPGELLLSLPALPIGGNYQLSNLRLRAGGRSVLEMTPAVATVRVIDQILVTSVRTRPLTTGEIAAKGIVLDSDDYLGFEFTLGVRLESKVVDVSFPVVFDRNDVPVPTPVSAPKLDVGGLRVPVAVPTFVPFMLRLPSGLGLGTGPGEGGAGVRIPSVIVIPGSVGYLKQFFSAQLFVANGAPAGAGLVVRDVTATLSLPQATTSNPERPMTR